MYYKNIDYYWVEKLAINKTAISIKVAIDKKKLDVNIRKIWIV